jgi:hypothetical protein
MRIELPGVMKGRRNFVLSAVLPAVLLLGLSCFPKSVSALQLTVLQSRLLGLPNRFVVKVEDFESDGLLTPSSVKTLVESTLAKKGIKLAADPSTPPLAHVIVNIRQEMPPDGYGVTYFIDLNIFNDTVINTTYKLRKGTIWMMGSYKVTPGRDFPKNVEARIVKLIEYFVEDYFTANPFLGGQRGGK